MNNAIKVDPSFKRATISADNAPMVWGTMTYRCTSCGKEIQVQLAVGCEGPRHLKKWVPVPFSAVCDGCRGFMNHVDWQNDKNFQQPRNAEPGYMFVPDPAYDCGKLVICK